MNAENIKARLHEKKEKIQKEINEQLETGKVIIKNEENISKSIYRS